MKRRLLSAFLAVMMVLTMAPVAFAADTSVDSYEGLVAASGTNFMRVMADYPDITLYRTDNLHPTVAGSYLAACTIYYRMFNKSPYGNKNT